MLYLSLALVGFTAPVNRRGLLQSAATAVSLGGVFPVPASHAAADPAAVDLVIQVSQLSMQARALQLDIRDAATRARASGKGYDALQTRVTREGGRLRQLSAAMEAAAPSLKLCHPEAADCDCVADPSLMRTAAQQVGVVQDSLAALNAALADGAFEELSLGGGALAYPGGRVEKELEALCEAADLFLDLAAGRPLMTARLAPGRAPAPRLCAAEGGTLGGPLFDAELNLIYDSKCGVCQWEVDFLKERDAAGRLIYTDLEADDFEEGAARNGGLDYATALSSFHAVRADGELLAGMPVFREAYRAVGLGWVWAIYDQPLAARILDFGYSLFARFRTDITRGSSLEVLVAARRASRAAAAADDYCEPCGKGR